MDDATRQRIKKDRERDKKDNISELVPKLGGGLKNKFIPLNIINLGNKIKMTQKAGQLVVSGIPGVHGMISMDVKQEQRPIYKTWVEAYHNYPDEFQIYLINEKDEFYLRINRLLKICINCGSNYIKNKLGHLECKKCKGMIVKSIDEKVLVTISCPDCGFSGNGKLAGDKTTDEYLNEFGLDCPNCGEKKTITRVYQSLFIP